MDVSFSAFTTANQNPAQSERIRFEGVISNEGFHYNPGDSIFTCPYEAIYFFSYSFYGILANLELTTGRLMKNNDIMIEAYCRVESSDAVYLQCSNSAILYCEENQQVYLAASDGNTVILASGPKTTFSGFMINANVSFTTK